MVNQVMSEYPQWLMGPVVLPPTDSEPSRYASVSPQLLFRAYHSRDTKEKRMVGLSQELSHLRREAHTHDGESEGQQEVIKVLIAKNKKFTKEKMKGDQECGNYVEGLWGR